MAACTQAQGSSHSSSLHLEPASQLMSQIAVCSCLAGTSPCRVLSAVPASGWHTRRCFDVALLDAYCRGALFICLRACSSSICLLDF